MMMMHKTLHLRDFVDKLLVSWKEQGRGLASNERSVDASILWFEDYIRKDKRKANFSDQKLHKQYNEQQNNNN